MSLVPLLFLLVSFATCQPLLQVLITEIMYNPREYQSFEFIEFYNNASTSLVTTGWKVTGNIQYTFPTVTIPVGGYIVLAADPVKVATQYKISPAIVLGPYNGSLDDDPKEVFLADSAGRPLVNESYKVSWNELANGLGSSLELICYTYNPINGTKKHHWVGSVAQGDADPHAEYSGSPGGPGRWLSCTGSAYDTAEIYFSEIMYHSYWVVGYQDQGEFIELKNNGTTAVDISGYRIIVQDGLRYSFPQGTALVPAGGFVIVASDPTFFRAEYPSNTAPVFGPTGLGGMPGKTTLVALVDTNGQVVDSLDYDNKDPFPYACDALGAGNSSLRTDSPFMEWIRQAGHPFGGWYQIKPQYQGNGQSLTRRSWKWTTDHGYNWKAADPSPGRDNLDTVLLPIISSTYVTPSNGGSKYYNITANVPVTVTFEIRPMSVPGNLSASGYTVTSCVISWFKDNIPLGTKTATTNTPCVFDGNQGFNITIPGQAENSIIRYWITIVFGGAVPGTISAPNIYYPFRYHGYFVEPVGGYSPTFDTYHIFIERHDWYTLQTNIAPGRATVGGCPVNILWNQGVNGTLIYKGEIFDSEIRFQGSRWQRFNGDAVDLTSWGGLGPLNGNNPAPLKIYSYRINLPGDRTINGNNAIILHKARQGCTFYQTPLINRLGADMGIPTATVGFARVRFNGRFLRFMMVIQHGGSEWIKAANKLIEHKCLHQSKEIILGDVFNSHGSPQEGPYVEGDFDVPQLIPQCPQYSLQDIYEATYGRLSYKKQDHSMLINLNSNLTSSMTSTAQKNWLTANFDVNQMLSYHSWMYIWALTWDQTLHNMVIVRRYSDKKWSWLPWDADSMFGENNGWNQNGGMDPRPNQCGLRWSQSFSPEIQNTLRILAGSILTPANMLKKLDEITLEFPASEYSASDSWAPYSQNIPQCYNNLRTAFTARSNYILGQLGGFAGNATQAQAARYCPVKPNVTITYNAWTGKPGPTMAPELNNSANVSNIQLYVAVGNPNYVPTTQTFIIERSINGGTTWTQIATNVAETIVGTQHYVSYTDNGVPVGNNISYRVISRNPAGTSLPSPMTTISVSRDCVWNPWTPYPPCPVSCGGSNQSQTRTNTGPPANGGIDCTGPFSNWTICNPQNCPINCVWGNWSAFGPCTVPCGGGNMTQTRNQTPAQYGGANCTGPSSNTTTCNTQNCPIDCIWGNWSAFGPCTTTCGGGNMTQTRTNSGAQFGGQPCTGPDTNTTNCSTNPCPIDCVWGNWSAFGACSVLCGGGNMTQTRNQTPPAQYGGVDCNGSDTNSTICNTQDCPVDCIWGNWSAFGPCSVSCGGGNMTQTRINSGPPQFGGIDCTGPFDNTTECNIQSCPIDCVGNWSSWAACDCATKTQTRTFGITTPAQFGGIDCNWTSSDTETQDCIPVSCGPEDCVGGWSNWSACDCTTFKQTQNYVVTTPESNGGKPCEAANGETKEQSCSPYGCPVDCVGQWGVWPACDCASNLTTSTFSVFVPAANGGLDCITKDGDIDTQPCTVDDPTTDCDPIDCAGDWDDWSDCNCVTNSTYRVFNITVLESNGGKPCTPTTVQTETKPCDCGLGGPDGSLSGLPAWAIALIALGVFLFLAVLVALAIGLFMATASAAFEVV